MNVETFSIYSPLALPFFLSYFLLLNLFLLYCEVMSLPKHIFFHWFAPASLIDFLKLCYLLRIVTFWEKLIISQHQTDCLRWLNAMILSGYSVRCGTVKRGPKIHSRKWFVPKWRKRCGIRMWDGKSDLCQVMSWTTEADKVQSR